MAVSFRVGLFAFQALVAVWQLELVNYVEHYGLTRKHLGDGKYEPVRPHHSWNAAHKATNWLLINLQRHFGSPLQTRPPLSAAPKLYRGGRAATTL